MENVSNERLECRNTMQTLALIQSELSAQLKSLWRIGLLIAGHESILIRRGQDKVGPPPESRGERGWRRSWLISGQAAAGGRVTGVCVSYHLIRVQDSQQTVLSTLSRV